VTRRGRGKVGVVSRRKCRARNWGVPVRVPPRTLAAQRSVAEGRRMADQADAPPEEEKQEGSALAGLVQGTLFIIAFCLLAALCGGAMGYMVEKAML
jgi:hypothetical protein